MRFEHQLGDKASPEWQEQYLDYKALKQLIYEAVKEVESSGTVAFSPRNTSLSVMRPGAQQRPAEERFIMLLEREMDKVNAFTTAKVRDLKKRVKSLKERANSAKGRGSPELLGEAKGIGDVYLALEKYVNLNYLGFHKILKKHDKLLVHAPCMQLYLTRLHYQPWVQGKSSDVLVLLSSIYSQLRGDTSGTKNEDSAQGFVRSTTKYWVHTVDVSAVKHHILQQLPVFQYNVEGEDQQDSQLINSVYLDNSAMELYHGRLDKKPNAIAVRIRWYGDGDPQICFVERKTHRESWSGEESVKERFTLPEAKVLPFLQMEYSLEQAKADLLAKKKSPEEVEKFARLFSEVQQQIDTKQLQPMVRTQYSRTAFQIPFDSTVRVSLDTNLTMIKENPEDAPACLESGRWYRDPSLPLPRQEFTRFPHAVLEVKLSLQPGQKPPEWLQDLLGSGYLTEVHKFSKFIHGSAALLPEMVQSVPYWIDDESVRTSMLQSARPPATAAIPVVAPTAAGNGGRRASLGARVSAALGSKPRKRQGPEDELSHPLLGDNPTLQLMTPRDEVGFGKIGNGRKGGFLDWYFNSRRNERPKIPSALPRTIPMRIEPKTFFANERTFLSWLHMAVTIGSIAAALLGFAGGETEAPGERRWADNLVEIIAMILLPVAVFMCAYALFVFIWRARAISQKAAGAYIDDRWGPLGLASVVVLALTAILVLSVVDFVEQLRSGPAAAPSPSGPLGDPLGDSLEQDPGHALQAAYLAFQGARMA